MALTNTAKTASNFIINKVPSAAVYQQMVTAGVVKDDQLYLIEEEDGGSGGSGAPAVGTTTDYSIYIGPTAPAANTTPLIWIDTSTSGKGILKFRSTNTTATWTIVSATWG